MIESHYNSLEKKLVTARKDNKTIGFVPTMGALHKGHISLVNLAKHQNDIVVVSIFVNPTQFDNANDLIKYPRTLESDVNLLKEVSEDIIVFVPDANDLYSDKIESKRYHYGGIEHEMEGKHRKGHFDGVGTVLNLLFRAVAPDKAYFGEKDFQQLQIVRKLVEIEELDVEIVGCPIVREQHGLAMSSRNKRLTPRQFEEAKLIFETLKEVKSKFPTLSIQKLVALAEERFLRSEVLELEYFEIANEKNLKTATRKIKNNKYRAFVAAFAGEVRLIDNMALN